MLEAVTSQNAHLYGDELQQMFRLRHRIFVERLGREALRSPDGAEKDQFDTTDAIYLLLIDDRTVIGCHRLLPTLKPHPISELFPHFCDLKGVPRARDTYEVNRSCVDLERLSADACRWARQAAMIGLMEFCIQAGIQRLSAVASPYTISHYLRCGWQLLPVGSPRELDGEMQVAVEIQCTSEGASAMRAAYGFRSPIVSGTGEIRPPQTACFAQFWSGEVPMRKNATIQEPIGGGVAGVHLSSVEVAEYLTALLPVLSKMARTTNMRMLAHLIDLAQAEAHTHASGQFH